MPDYALQPYEAKIIGETEKAWKVSIECVTRDGENNVYFTKFMPKKAAMTKAERKRADEAEINRFKAGAERYSKMIEFAKAHGVKGVREGLRKETILKKIKDKGLDYDYYKGK